jgi:hypothetical protein
MVQSTFTKQKRELAKALSWIEQIRAQEVRIVTRDANGNVLTETRESYVDESPEAIARRVLGAVVQVVGEHGARQQANSKNRGRFVWEGVSAELTVPQLRALQDAFEVLSNLVHRLPRRNPKLISNIEVAGKPAFAHTLMPQFKRKVRYVPFEEADSTRIRTYEEYDEILEYTTQKVEVDHGIPVLVIERLKEMVGDLKTAIQVAIDDANSKGQESDPVLDRVIEEIRLKLESQLPK